MPQSQQQPGQGRPDASAQPGQTIRDLIKGYAERTPSALAIVSPHRQPLTYQGLQAQIEYTVGVLRSQSVGANDRVAIVLPGGPEMAVAFLAVSSGATSAPLNPASGADEFQYYLSGLNPKALLVGTGIDSPARAVARARGLPTLELSPVLEAEAGVFTLEGDRHLEAACDYAQPDDVALALYTSGTTSRPKLVLLTHSNLCTSAVYMKDTYELDEDDRCLNIMPLFHIHGLAVALSAPLVAGGSIVCSPGFDPSDFFDWVDAFRPTWYTAVPTIHLAILGQAQANRATIARCPLRFICSRSAALPTSVMVELEQVFGAPVLEAYGLTEVSSHVASNRLPPHERKPGSVGRAAGPEVAIMDPSKRLLAPAAIGEIIVRGESVFQGYDGHPEANKNAFVDGWFRTGDLGYLDEDGYLFITGRLKEIINRGGAKVAPKEIDDVLLDQPAVAQAVTFAVPHPTLGEDIAAAVVLQKGTTASEQRLREWAFARLADHKVPSQVLILDQIPAGPTGKVQRSSLAKELAHALRPAFVSPRSRFETTLAGLWAEVLGREQVGLHDNFFALGGDSLTAAQLVSRIRPLYHVELPLTSIFREPVFADLVLLIQDLILTKIESLPEEEAQDTGQSF